MEFTGERVVPGNTPQRIFDDHIARYNFAKEYIKGKCVLDAACGTGYGTKTLKDGGAKEVTGVDIDEESIIFARSKYPKNRFIVSDVSRLPFEDKSFDAIVSFETIEHIPNYQMFINEAFRVLKNNGSLIISSPNRTITSPNKSLKEKPDNKFHITEFTLDEFQNLLSKKFYDLNVFGQRLVSNYYLKPMPNKVLSKLDYHFNLGLKKKIFSEASGPNIKKLKKSVTSRYFIIECKKNEF